ncbi:MAG: cytochrome P450 [Spongiibacteraceae bacterium]|jgi:cytochrome P450|nr:cytochrome P450 [Spongiibacteraceae bacterium]
MSTATPAQDYRQQPDNQALSHIPGDDGWPLVGRGLQMFGNLLGVARDHHRRFGEVSRTSLGPQRGLLVVGADNYQRIYLDRDRQFSAEMGYAEQLGKFYKGGLLLRDFDEHRFQRRIMQGAFKTPAMRNYVALMNPMLLASIQQWPRDKTVSFFPLIKHALLEVGARVFIGLKEFGGEADLLNEAFINLNDGLGAVLHWNLPGMKFRRGLKGKADLQGYFARLVGERRGAEGDDMFTFMCNERSEDGELFSDTDIVQHAAFLLFAAHDTTTSLLSHMVMHLAQNQDWQQRLREECQALDKPALEYEDLEKLTLMDYCIQETLRLHPSVPIMARRTTVDMELGGFAVPAHTMVFLPIAFNHRDANYWSDPERFDPLRFSPERAEFKRHSFCYHPFGGGAHKCIGLHFAAMQAKCFLHQLLLNCRLTCEPGYQPKLQWVPLPKPRDGARVRFVPLNR